MKVKGKYFRVLVGAGFAALLYDPLPALAAVAPPLGTAASYTVLGTNTIPTSGTVTCTTSTITGNVGSTFTSITNTGPCLISGSIDAPVAGTVVTDFNIGYSALNSLNPTCTGTIPTVSTILPPGVYCSAAGTTLGAGVIFTLNGSASDVWVFKVGTSGFGALTGTGFTVLMGGSAQACNVFWRTAEAATMTDSFFKGTILSGAAITVTRGNYVGRALATTDVTVTDVQPMTFAGCATIAATTLVTQVSSPAVTLGTAIGDTATLSGGNTPTGTITFTAFGPNDLTCTGAPIFAPPAVTVNGNGPYPSPSFTPGVVGTYRWIANYSGDANNAPTANTCNAANELVVVSPVGVAAPTLTTQASANVTLGGAISDTATLSGGNAPTGTITFALFGPNDVACTGAPIFTPPAVTVTGNGVYVSPSTTPLLAGTYRWIANYSGDANNAPTANTCNAPNELVVVAPVGAATPTLTTQASPTVTLGPGVTISDTGTLSGGNAPTGTITFALFGPNDALCAGPAVFTSTVPVNGNSTYLSAPFPPTTAGTYRWIANYSGDANNAATANVCNAVNELVLVVAPVPTLSEWAMIMLVALLVLVGMAGIRRHAM